MNYLTPVYGTQIIVEYKINEQFYTTHPLQQAILHEFGPDVMYGNLLNYIKLKHTNEYLENIRLDFQNLKLEIKNI